MGLFVPYYYPGIDILARNTMYVPLYDNGPNWSLDRYLKKIFPELSCPQISPWITMNPTIIPDHQTNMDHYVPSYIPEPLAN